MGFKTIPQSNSPVLQAGKFRHRLEIVQPSPSQDTAGGVNNNVNTLVKLTWGTVEALSGTEKFAAHEFVSQVTHSIYIRFDPNIVFTSAMQVWFNSRQFQIEAVLNPDERNKVLQLMCIEINNSGQQDPTPAESTL